MLFSFAESWQHRLLQLIKPSISNKEEDLYNCWWRFSFLCWRPGKSTV